MISINATLFVQMLHLLVLIWILNKIMYQPLRRLVAERSKSLETGLARAQEYQEGARQKMGAYQKNLEKGRAKVREDLLELRQETEAKAQELISETQDKARADYRDLMASIDSQLVEARKEIKAEAEAVAVGMASRVLGRGLS
ncbi:MAG: ATP synthase F0 subunit B [Deltaproteobacteria bacterium]|nr:ATP synthase F0 subunit B [Deltaproteobacteria bacterium]